MMDRDATIPVPKKYTMADLPPEVVAQAKAARDPLTAALHASVALIRATRALEELAANAVDPGDRHIARAAMAETLAIYKGEGV